MEIYFIVTFVGEHCSWRRTILQNFEYQGLEVFLFIGLEFNILHRISAVSKNMTGLIMILTNEPFFEDLQNILYQIIEENDLNNSRGKWERKVEELPMSNWRTL